MNRLMLMLVALLALSPIAATQVQAQTPETGTLRITMLSCPPDFVVFSGDEAECTEVIQDDGSATVALPNGDTRPLTEFERGENGAYVITTEPGMVQVSGLASDKRSVMVNDSNVLSEDSGTWFVPAGADIDGQVYYADERAQTPLPPFMPGREPGTIVMYLMLCENGYPTEGTEGCVAIEDDGRIWIPHADAGSPLNTLERNEAGGYLISGGAEHPQLKIDKESIESDNGWDTTYEADEITMSQEAVWNYVEGTTREVYIFYTPMVGTPGEGSDVLMHDDSLPPAEPAEQSPSMGGPEGIGGVNVHVLGCDEGVAPSLENCTEPVSSVDEIMVDTNGRAPRALSSFEQNEDGSWAVSGPGGKAVLTGMEPIRTDRGITNGEVVDDSTISFTIDSGNSFDLYVIYYFD